MQSTEKLVDAIDLSYYGAVVRRRWLPALLVSSATFGAIALFTYLQKPTYQAEGKLLLNKVDRVSTLTGLSDHSGELSGLTLQSNPLDTEAEVVRSVPIAQQTIAALKLQDAQKRPLTPDTFLKRLKVKGIRGTDVLSVAYQSHSPPEAAMIVNQVIRLYLENNIVTNRAEARAAREFIDKQLPTVEARVREAEAALRQFKEANRVVALGEEAKSTVLVTADLERQLSQVQAELADANRRSQVLQRELAMNPQQAIAVSSLSQSREVQKVLEDYQQVQNQLAVEKTRYRETHPKIANLRRKEAALGQQLEQRIAQTSGSTAAVSMQDLQMGELKQSLAGDLVRAEVNRLGLASRATVLSQMYTGYRDRIRVLPRLEQSQRQLERQLQAAQSTYEQLLKKLQEVQVVENQNIGNARIISKALVPTVPVAPQRSLNLVFGAGLGLFLGLLTAIVLESRDKSLKTVDEAKRLLDYSVLGVIPTFKKKSGLRHPAPLSELPVRDNPYSPVSTAYEMLQTNLGFSMPDQPLQTVLITSAMPGEGRSSVAANLAVVTAQMGRRVLLIDADMRLPRQHLLWQVAGVGLSDVLVRQAEVSEAIREVLVNLDLLPCGTIPPNPTALLNSNRLVSLLEELTQTYDLIILDSPPLELAVDGLLLGKLADGVLLVIRPGATNAAKVLDAKAHLTQAAQLVLGMVINGVARENDADRQWYDRKYADRRESIAIPPQSSLNDR